VGNSRISLRSPVTALPDSSTLLRNISLTIFTEFPYLTRYPMVLQETGVNPGFTRKLAYRCREF
jgi:hypothetical protein